MRFRKARSILFAAMFLAISLIASSALADEFDQAMRLTFSQPIAIPDQVLPAGSYWFIMANAHGDPSGAVSDRVMQVFDADRKKVIATMAMIPEQTPKNSAYSARGSAGVSSHVILTLADRSPKSPPALLSLTYPGRVTGHAFGIRYHKQEREAFDEFPKITMKVGKNGVIESTEATNR